MRSLYNVNAKHNGSKTLTILMVILLVITLFLGFFFAFSKARYLVSSTTTTSPSSRFQEALSRVCMAPHPRLEYQGANSFFEYLQKPHHHSCTSWIRLASTNEQHQDRDNISEIPEREAEINGMEWEYICITEDANIWQKPCLIYSFTQHTSGHVEKHIKSLGCNIYVFPELVDEDFDNIREKREDEVNNSSIPKVESNDSPNNDSTHHHNTLDNPSIKNNGLEYNFEVSRHPRDLERPIYNSNNLETVDVRSLQGQSLDTITSTLGHQGQRISFIRLDSQGREWPILRQLVSYHGLVDVHQISAKIYVPIEIREMSAEERHVYFAKLHQIFEGLNCLGYKLIRSQPLSSRSEGVILPEMTNPKFSLSYQVNWMKISTNK